MARNAYDTAPFAFSFDRTTGDTKNCTVNALRNVTGVPYATAYQFARDEMGRRDGKGLPRRVQARRYEHGPVLGHTFTPVLAVGYSGRGRITLRRFLRENPTGTFYVCKSGHAFAIVDGQVLDHSAPKMGTLLQHVWKVEPVAAPAAPAAPAPTRTPAKGLAAKVLALAGAQVVSSADAPSLACTPKQLRGTCQRLVKAGSLVRVGRGQYKAA